ncbi:MAG: hypothetical protein BRC50_01510 [Cyanobacteria bacterium SW_11_48_12]|nr:MAG: hypothetical protein BRC50_01510 [Cyanobacteria bacterium SW_11_48_12]
MHFARAIQIFEGRTEEWESKHRDYGEKRFVAVGSLSDRFITVVFIPFCFLCDTVNIAVLRLIRYKFRMRSLVRVDFRCTPLK